MSLQPSPCAREPRGFSMQLLRPTYLQLLLILLAFAVGSLDSHTGNRLQADDADLTPAAIADRIEQSMRKFDSIESAVEYTETRNLAPWGSNKPVWVDGEGRYVYRSDGIRWFLDEHANTFSGGDTYLTPERRISGFDGRKNFHFNSSRS